MPHAGLGTYCGWGVRSMTSREAGDASKLEVNLPALDFWGILRRCEDLGWIGPTTANT